MAEIIDEIASVWPDCRIVHGRARHSESQGGIERLNRTTQNKLAAWMQENQSKNWSVGRLFVRWQINTLHSQAIGTSPYRLLTGQDPRVGLSSLPLRCVATPDTYHTHHAMDTHSSQVSPLPSHLCTVLR
jgi:hypothetical protein